MSNEFDRPLYGYRFAEVLFGDSLQTIAARELGDGARWVDLIAYNNLVPPFVTQDLAGIRPGVVGPGSMILVPAPAPVISTTANPEEVFEKDVALGRNGELMTADGDFLVAAGRDNLRQALKNRIETERGELIFHPEYGSNIRRLIGVVNGPTATLLAAQYARSAVQADPRVARVTVSKATVNGDVINVTTEAETVAGRTVSVAAAP